MKTTSTGPNPRDIRAGYNRIWVLSSTKTTASIVTLNTAGAKVGKTISINLGTTTDLGPGAQNGANTLGVGSSYVWVAGVRTWQRLGASTPTREGGRQDLAHPPGVLRRRRRAVDGHAQPGLHPEAQAVDLLVLDTLPVGSATGGTGRGPLWLTFGSSFFWLSQSTPNDLGQIMPALLFRLSQTDLSTVASGTLPAGATPGAVQCVTVGGGLVWVTDGVGSLYTIQP